MAMTPVSVALLSSLLKHEKIHWAGWFGIAISVVGFYLVIAKQPGTFVFSWENLKGDMMIFCGNLVWAVYTVFSKPLLGRITPLKWSSLTLAVGTVFYLPFCVPAFSRQDFGQISFKAWSMLAFSGAIALAFGYVVWYSSVKRIGNTKTVIYGNIIPIFTVIFAYILISETIGLWQAVGAVIILVGVYLTRSGYRVFSTGGKVG
jgi:drug/metabolite transporter (DMT)-like permease